MSSPVLVTILIVTNHHHTNTVMECFGVSQDSSDYQARHRSLELNIENRTEHRLEFQGDYFESGVWFSNPGHHVVESQGYRRFIVTSQGGGFLRGVTGVMKYR